MSGGPELHSRTRCETLAHRIEKMPTRDRLCEHCFPALKMPSRKTEQWQLFSGELSSTRKGAGPRTSQFPNRPPCIEQRVDKIRPERGHLPDGRRFCCQVRRNGSGPEDTALQKIQKKAGWP